MDRRLFLQSATLATLECLAPKLESYGQEIAAKEGETISVQTRTVKGPLPHSWEECTGSDRAAVGMRAQWLSDLELVKEDIGVRSVRFHGLFDDEMGVWSAGKEPIFLYIDMVFDAMLERGVRPFVELSFMPKALASGEKTIFWYKGNTTPPKEMKDWGNSLVRSHNIVSIAMGWKKSRSGTSRSGTSRTSSSGQEQKRSTSSYTESPRRL